MKDFFVSYASTDRPWAEWIAWVLDENGYTVAVQSWVPVGKDFVGEVQQAMAESQRTLIVLSDSYLRSVASQREWSKASQLAFEPLNQQIIPIRVEDVKPTGLLSQSMYLDLVDKSEIEAEQAILAALKELPEGYRSSVADAPATPKETIQVDASDNGQLKLERRYHTVQFFVEPLTDDIGIEMMQIPAGTFLMGSPEDEPERSGAEGPQREVNVATFFMGKYPITQAQWRAVAALPQASRALNPDPSKFKGEKRPVEQVSWYDVVEFCERLSAYTGRDYRLPTEAEWEYACCAGTMTPFHVGETLSTDLANYNGNYTYGRGAEGIYREETTDVGSFPPNAFGLCDMHGNVWEWCLDHWHESYEDAPLDGSAWLTGDKDAFRVYRGGSWVNDPQGCRSASRIRYVPNLTNSYLGFRVVCVMP